MDQDDLNALKASELKMMCKERGLRVSGTKSELIGRLMENQHQIENGPINESLDAAVDALLERHGKKETKKIKTYPEPTQKDDEIPIEAELLEEPGLGAADAVARVPRRRQTRSAARWRPAVRSAGQRKPTVR